jgi:hypothetical protein
MGIVERLKGGDDAANDKAANEKADAAAQKLGYLIYREKTQGTPSGTEVDALVAEISSLQEQTESHTVELPEGATPSGEVGMTTTSGGQTERADK